MVDIIFLLFVCLFFSILLLVGLLFLREDLADRRASRQRVITRWRYDELGNPEFYFDPSSGDYYQPPLGNTPYPSLTLPEVKKVTIPLPGEASINPLRAQYSVEVEASEAESEITLLASAKRAGLAMTPAIKQIAGVTGGSRFQELSRLWRKLPK